MAVNNYLFAGVIPLSVCCLVFTRSYDPLGGVVLFLQAVLSHCVLLSFFNTQLCPAGCCCLVFTRSYVPLGVVVLFLNTVMFRWVLFRFLHAVMSRWVLLFSFYTQLCHVGCCCFIFTRSYVPLGAVVLFLNAVMSRWVFRFLHAVMSRWVVLSCFLHLKFQCSDTPTPSSLVIRALESRQLQVSVCVCVCAGDGQ